MRLWSVADILMYIFANVTGKVLDRTYQGEQQNGAAWKLCGGEPGQVSDYCGGEYQV